MKRTVLGILLLVTTITSLCAQADLQPLVNIKLNKSESITLKQLKTRVEVYQRQSKTTTSFTLEQKKEILDALIDEKLVVQAAQKAGITITDTQVNQYFLENISSQVGRTVTEVEFANLVKEQSGLSLDEFMQNQVGMTTAEYKSYLKSQLIAQQYIISLKQAEIQQIAPTDSEVRSYFEMNKASFVQNDIMKIFLVVIPKGQNADESKKLADELYTALKNATVSFDEMKIRMKAENSGFQAGDMYVSKTAKAADQLGIDYNTLLTLFQNNPGYFSDINETDSDYQFYVIRQKYEAKMLGLSDVVQPDTTITVYEYIKNLLAKQKQSDLRLIGICLM
jgi:hypothetical protein